MDKHKENEILLVPVKVLNYRGEVNFHAIALLTYFLFAVPLFLSVQQYTTKERENPDLFRKKSGIFAEILSLTTVMQILRS